jgi:hypothetical protein
MKSTLDDIIDLAAELTTNLLVTEFVASDNSILQRFETLCGRHFEIVRFRYVEGTTCRQYLLRKRA